ncbi:MAG: DUF1194 domain-containing protein [Proteobacteria bacterium]|nr:DUF1194 domain-containing protein [Pseudomonadota bacterium]
MRQAWLFIALFLLALHAAPRAQSTRVDLALVLALDISASVDQEEYRLQMTGLAAALRSKAVVEAIGNGPQGRIAVSVMQWSGTNTQKLVIPWTVIDSAEAARKLGLAVLAAERADPGGGTSLSAALRQASLLFAEAPDAPRRVIDISVDGINNIGPSLPKARRDTLGDGITINGLAIATDWPKLQEYLELHVIGGRDAFATTAKGYEDFGPVMLRKLIREIQPPGAS